MEKIKILQVTGSLSVGGMENVAMNIFRFIDKDKFEINFVVYGEKKGQYEQEVISNGGNVYHIPFPHEGILKYCNSLKKIMVETGPYDVVHSHNLFPSGLVMKVAKTEKIPIRISHAHTNRNDKNISFYRKIYQFFMRNLMRKNSTYFFACSQKAGKYLFGKGFNGNKNNEFIMINGIDSEKFNISQDKVKILKKEFNIQNEKVVGHVGRFIEVKNHKFLINVFEKMLKQNTKLKLLLIGDGPLLNTIKKEVNDKNIENNVIFAGTRNNIPELLSIMDAFVLPSKYEGVSISLVEAQAAGIPFVVSESAYSDESKITGYGISLNLDESFDMWEKEIFKQIERGKLKNSQEIIENKGYDIKKIVKYLENTYYSKKEV